MAEFNTLSTVNILFVSIENSMVIVVATCAFALGIDKSDIRLVFNVGTPNSLLNYAQSSGRVSNDIKIQRLMPLDNKKRFVIIISTCLL